ncbi:hypothetical protein ACQPZQ_16735 [Pseudonocardia sp. CA-142604]|uniref:hypothetical protein n=1 Tax=Pseudonocardia sp. CA-142604 TaxID=3240024 RepID=UPI003D8BAE10
MQTTAASIGRLGLAAAAFGGPTLARGGRPRAAGGPELLVNAAIATGWLSERRTLRGRSLDRDAKVMVTAKDVLVAGTVLTGAAALVGTVVTRREPPAGPPDSGDQEPSPDEAIDVDGNRRYLQTMTRLNHTFALLGVAAAPFINFALFDSYHPHPLRSFFSLW